MATAARSIPLGFSISPNLRRPRVRHVVCFPHVQSIQPVYLQQSANSLRSCDHLPQHPLVSCSQIPETTDAEATRASSGIPRDRVKTLAKFKSSYNYIRVLQISGDAKHPLADSRLLLLDSPGNIQSIHYRGKHLTHAYFDVLATLPPLLPPGPLGILGFGAGSAAGLMLKLYPFLVIHGWEIDPSVITVGRKFFCLSQVEQQYEDRLHLYVGNALGGTMTEGFAGMVVDLFRKGCLIPELLDPNTWEVLKNRLRDRGRIMVNVGGSCVEPDDSLRDGNELMNQCLRAMSRAFPGKLSVLKMVDGGHESTLALTGRMPDIAKWKVHLCSPLTDYANYWAPYPALC